MKVPCVYTDFLIDVVRFKTRMCMHIYMCMHCMYVMPYIYIIEYVHTDTLTNKL